MAESIAKDEKLNYGSVEDPVQAPLINKQRLEETGWFSVLTFGWMSPLLAKGNEKVQLDPKDLTDWPLPENCRTDAVKNAFDDQWNRAKASKGKAASLAWSLAHAFGADFVRAGFLKLGHDLLIFVGPQVLNAIIQFLRNPSASPSQGLVLTALVTFSQLGMSLCLRHYFHKCYLTGLKVRTAVLMAVYRKALTIAQHERQARSTGEITNLVSVDAQRLQDLVTYLHAIWYSFLQIGLAIYFLWQQLGPSCLGGVAVIIFMMPVTKAVAQLMAAKQKLLMAAKDQRVQINNEVLGSMKVIKFQAWEASFQAKILALRNTELAVLWNYFVADYCSTLLWSSVPLLVAVGTFAVYVWTGNTLDVAEALTALALFEILRFPLFMLPQVINNIVEAMISLQRVQAFLLCEDHHPIPEGDQDGIHIHNASFVYDSKRSNSVSPKSKAQNDQINLDQQQISDMDWEIRILKSQLQDAENLIHELETGAEHNDHLQCKSLKSTCSVPADTLLSLRRITLECKPGDFIAVVGAVGAGKSTLLISILGELRPLTGGFVTVKGSIAYFGQNPFILNDTVRGNILFGNTQIDLKKYRSAISVCALNTDLQMLPGGDDCEIGEKGITLSGGQKARIAMARAVYHDADIYLLDDPLAAVDAHVGRHLFHHCILQQILNSDKDGYPLSKTQKPKSLILITNALQYLSHPRVDRIVVLNEGRIQEQGTYKSLTNNKSSLFSTFLKSFTDSLGDKTDPAPLDDTDKQLGPLTPNFSASSLNALGDVSLSPDIAKVLAPLSPTRSSSLRKDLDGSLKSSHEDQNNHGALTTDEFTEREIGHVSLAVYASWARAAGGIWVAFLILLATTNVEGINILSRWWLTYWSTHGGTNDIDHRGQAFYLAIYGAINLSAVLATFLRLLVITLGGLAASRKLFSRVLDSVLAAPMAFFDVTPVGRIVNRFSKDMYTVDEQLVSTLRSYLATMGSVCSTIVVVSSITPWFTVCLIPIIGYYLLQSQFFTKSYRELKRLDSVSRSPMYALLGETLDGITTIRAFGAQNALTARLVKILDLQQTAYFLTFTAQCWLAIRLELVGTMIITFACVFAVMEHSTMAGNEQFAGLAGLSISYALSVTQALNWSVRMSSDLEANMISVERIEQYCRLPSEASRQVPGDKELMDRPWPSEGQIVFLNVQLRYRPNLPLVLKGLNLTIPAKAKVGIVGRTGAGKSTLMVVLMRIVELDSGRVEIDGVDIRTVGLTLLRSRIAVIPQDPCLFQGSVRSNLDPFGDYTDDRLHEVLRRVGLYERQTTTQGKSTATSSPVSSLSDKVLEGGSNFSVGQRQLLVIARALLRESQIIIMDEATAAVDAETDSRIQKVMRTEFKHATCLTVAHRLNTIMDSTHILVMDAGRAAEFDTPQALLNRPDGLFRKLVDTWEADHGEE